MGTEFADHAREVEPRSTPAELEQLAAFRTRYPYAAQLRRRRAQFGLSQTDLAAASGIGQAEISRIERGETSPTERTAARLAAALHDHWELTPDERTVPDAATADE